MARATTSGLQALIGPITRRGFIGRSSAAPLAAAATGGIATEAAAAITGANLRTYKGKYAIDGHRVVDGFFASPKGKTNLDVVVVVPSSGRLDQAAEATARSFAAQGWLAIAPDLPTTYRGAAAGGKPAMVAAMMRDVPRLKKLMRGSGKVVFAS